MLKEKKVWDIVDGTRAAPITITQTRKKEKNNAVTLKIIKQRVNSDFYTNIIGERNPQRYQKTLKRICSQVGQSVVYSILKELLNYSQVIKPLEYKKITTSIFAKVKQLIYRLQSIVTKQ